MNIPTNPVLYEKVKRHADLIYDKPSATSYRSLSSANYDFYGGSTIIHVKDTNWGIGAYIQSSQNMILGEDAVNTRFLVTRIA